MEAFDLRILFTVASFLGFLSILSWAFSPGRDQAFAEAAELPFNDAEELALQRKAMILGR